MIVQSWAKCPFCSKIFEVMPNTRDITIDGRMRYVCHLCQPTPPLEELKSNGQIAKI